MIESPKKNTAGVVLLCGDGDGPGDGPDPDSGGGHGRRRWWWITWEWVVVTKNIQNNGKRKKTHPVNLE